MAATTITVTLRLFGDLRRGLPSNGPAVAQVALPAGATVADAVAHAGLDPAHEEIITAVNGEQTPLATVLQPGDEVVLVSPMEGG